MLMFLCMSRKCLPHSRRYMVECLGILYHVVWREKQLCKAFRTDDYKQRVMVAVLVTWLSLHCGEGTHAQCTLDKHSTPELSTHPSSRLLRIFH